MARTCIPTTDACDEKAQPPHSIPEWREICNAAACELVSVEHSDVSATASTASPSSESSRSTSVEENSPIDSCLGSPTGCCTTSAAPSSDESDFEGGSSGYESATVDSGVGDGKTTVANLQGELLAGPRLANTLAHILVNLAIKGAAQGGATERCTSFHASRPPHLSIRSYLGRICEYFDCSKQCYVLSLIYIDRVLKSRPQFVLNELSVHRFLLTSLVVSIKFHDDVHHSNVHFANVGGVSLKTLNRLEKDFLQLIGWQVCISADEYDQYLKLIDHVSLSDISNHSH